MTLFRLRQIQFVLGISKCCQCCQQFWSPPFTSLYLSPSLSSSFPPSLSFLLPSFFCCSLNAQIEFICCEFPMHTKWIFVSCLGYVQCYIYIHIYDKYTIYMYANRERDMFVCLPRGHCCIIWSGGWLKNNSIWFYLHCFDGFKRCTTLCQAACGRGGGAGSGHIIMIVKGGGGLKMCRQIRFEMWFE